MSLGEPKLCLLLSGERVLVLPLHGSELLCLIVQAHLLISSSLKRLCPKRADLLLQCLNLGHQGLNVIVFAFERSLVLPGDLTHVGCPLISQLLDLVLRCFVKLHVKRLTALDLLLESCYLVLVDLFRLEEGITILIELKFVL